MNRKSNPKRIKASSFARGILTDREVEIVTKQIRFNSSAIDRYIKTIDLLVNKEKCPKDANTLAWLRQRLSIAIDESDTFRQVLWRHKRMTAAQVCEDMDATSFLLGCIKTRNQALIAQAAMK